MWGLSRDYPGVIWDDVGMIWDYMRIMRSFWGFGDLIGMRRDNIGLRDITPHKGLAQMGGERGWGHLGLGG